VDELALVVTLLAGLDVPFKDPPLAEIDVAFLFVNPEHHHELYPTHFDQATYTTNPTTGELQEQYHTLNVAVLEQGHVYAMSVMFFTCIITAMSTYRYLASYIRHSRFRMCIAMANNSIKERKWKAEGLVRA
jgi:hypothetical protein